MNEEEKKAIEDLNNLIEPFKNKDNSMTYKKEDLWSYLKYEDYKAIDILLNLINKQQKEIERLKNAEEYSKLGKETLLDTIHKQQKEIEDLKDVQQQICNEELLKKEYVQNNYIKKDKIKDRIEQLESYYDTSKETTPTSTNQFIIDVVAILEELLEKQKYE